MERQKHGFEYEQYIKEKYKISLNSNYGHKFDGLYKNTPIQIKYMKYMGEMCIGSLFNLRNINTDFILIIGFWKDNKQEIIEEIILYIDHTIFKKHLYFSDDLKVLKTLKEEMKLITNLKVDDDNWGIFCSKYRKKWPEQNLIKLRFKRDHKNQKRIQCAIPNKNIENFFSLFKEYTLEKNMKNTFSSIQEKNRNLEQFFTKPEVVNVILKKTNELLKLETFDIIIEPSAGSGSFVKQLLNIKTHNQNLIALDISPLPETEELKKNILKQDFIKDFNIKDFKFDENSKIITIGNPPFGRQSSLAKKFIAKSCSFSDIVAFILPKSFKKESMYNTFPLNFHKIYELELNNYSFFYETKEYSVPCIFQIWEKRNDKRSKKQLLKPNENYNFVKKNNNPLFAFRRVGSKAGTFIFSKIDELSEQSHYFLKYNKDLNSDIYEKIKKHIWDDNNTVGPKSISKQELISFLNQVL